VPSATPRSALAPLRLEDALQLRKPVALPLDPDVPAVARVEHDPEHAAVVRAGLLAALVERVRLRADAARERHQLGDALVAVVPAALGDLEVAEVGQRPDARVVRRADRRGEPGAIGGVPAVVLDDDVDPVRVAERGQTVQRVGGAPRDLLGRAGARGVHADRVAAEEARGRDPAEVVLGRLPPRGVVGVAELALGVAHDQEAFHAGVVRAALHVGEIIEVDRALLEEGVHVLDGVEPELFPRERREVARVERAGANRPVQRPLGEGDGEGPGVAARQQGGAGEAEAGHEDGAAVGLHGRGLSVRAAAGRAACPGTRGTSRGT
jgi:hypothetical protein